MMSGNYHASLYSPAATFPARATFPHPVDQVTQDARRRRDIDLTMGSVPFVKPHGQPETHRLYRIPPHFQTPFGSSLISSAQCFSRQEHADEGGLYTQFETSIAGANQKEFGPTFGGSIQTSHPSSSPAEDICAPIASSPPPPSASTFHPLSPMTMNANTPSFNQSLHVSNPVSNLPSSSAYYVPDYQHPIVSSPEPLTSVPSPRSRPSQSQIGTPMNGNEASPVPSLLYPPLSHPSRGSSPEDQFHHEQQSHSGSGIDQQQANEFTPWHVESTAPPANVQSISHSTPAAGVEVGLRQSSASSSHNLGSPLIDEEEGQPAGRGVDLDQCGGRFERQMGVSADAEAQTVFHQRQLYHHEHQNRPSSNSFRDHSELDLNSGVEAINVTQHHPSSYSELSANVTFLSQHRPKVSTSFDDTTRTVEMDGHQGQGSLESNYGSVQTPVFIAQGSSCGVVPSFNEEPLPAQSSLAMVAAQVNAPTPRYPHSPHQLSLAASGAVDTFQTRSEAEPQLQSQNGTLVPLSHYNHLREPDPVSPSSSYSYTGFASQERQAFQLRNPPSHYQLQERRQQRYSHVQHPYPPYDEYRPIHISNQSHHLRLQRNQHHADEPPPLGSLSPLLPSSSTSSSITASSLASASSISAHGLHPTVMGHDLGSPFHPRSNTTLISRTMAGLGSSTTLGLAEGCFTPDGTYISAYDPSSFGQFGSSLVRGGESMGMDEVESCDRSARTIPYTIPPTTYAQHSTPYTAIPLVTPVRTSGFEYPVDEPGMDVCDDGSPLSPVGGSSSFTFSPSSSDSVHGTPLTASSLASTSPITSGHYGSFPSSNGSIPPPSISAPPASHSRKVPPPPSLAIRRAGEQKKQTLACLFCRERKIACGRPAEGSPDPTCNQCARRCFKCEYPTESKRGQHKRSKKKVLAEKAPN